MGSQAEGPSRRQTPRGVGRGGGLQPKSVGGLISTPQPRGLANLRGPQRRQVLARQSRSGEANRELAAIPRRERGKRRRRGSEGLLASCWPKRTGIVKGENESRGELDGDGNTVFATQAKTGVAGKRPRRSVYPVDGKPGTRAVIARTRSRK